MKTIYRSQRDKKIFGVCGGLAEATGIDATILRLVTVVTTVFAAGSLIPIYIIAALVMPKEPLAPPPGQAFGPYGPYGNQGGAPGGAVHYGASSQGYYPPGGAAGTSPQGAGIDEMMKDIEKKALQNEIEELKAKLAKYEKNDKGDE